MVAEALWAGSRAVEIFTEIVSDIPLLIVVMQNLQLLRFRFLYVVPDNAMGTKTPIKSAW